MPGSHVYSTMRTFADAVQRRRRAEERLKDLDK